MLAGRDAGEGRGAAPGLRAAVERLAGPGGLDGRGETVAGGTGA